MRCWAGFALACLAASVQAALPHTQQAAEAADDEVLVDATFGYPRVAPGGGWMPVTVFVTSADEPIAGTVSIEYSSAAEGTLQVAPFAAAAGTTIRVPMVASVAWYEQELEILARNERGAVLARRQYVPFPDVDQGKLPSLWSGSKIVLNAAPGFPAQAVADALPEDSQSHDRDRALADIQPRDLPTHEAAYDRVELVIVDRQAAERTDPRTVAALRRWVHSGGRLLVVADPIGDVWTTWLEGSSVKGDVAFGERTTRSPPDSSPVRAPRLGRIARAAGWRVGWPDSDGLPRLAEGPVGLGWLTVMGATPSVSQLEPASIQDGDASSQPSPFEPIVASWQLEWPSLSVDPWIADLASNRRRWLRLDGESGIAAHLDSIGGDSSAGTGPMLLLALLPLSLAALLGPIDFFLLGRLRRRHLAWMTAAVWILVLGVCAAAMPGLMLGSDSRIATFAAVDAILINRALPATDPRNRAADLTEAPNAYTSGISVLFAGEQNAFELRPDAAEGIRWHALDDSVSSSSGVAAPIVYTQATASSDPWQSRAIRPIALPARAWSITLLRDNGPVDLGLAAALWDSGSGYTLELSGGPDSARVLGGQMVVAGEVFEIDGQGPVQGRHTFLPGDGGASLGVRRDARLQLAAALLKSDPRRRDAARTSRVQAGWASVTLLLEQDGSAKRFDVRGEVLREDAAVWRLMIPLQEPQPGGPPAAPPDGGSTP